MKFDGSGLLSWAMVALTFGLALFVIVSPTGSFVESAMDYSARQNADRASGGFLAARASDAAQRTAILDSDQ